MCGIIFVRKIGKDAEPANIKALDIFENQSGRGMRGFGVLKVLKNKTIVIERSTEGIKFMWDIHNDPVDTIMVHHRTPTSTPNLTHQTHPIYVNNGSLAYDYYIIHNGMIHNDEELKEEHEDLGFKYTTDMKDDGVEKFNDSEALAVELSRYIENQIGEYKVRGSAAFVALRTSKKTGKADRIYFGRHGSSPLRMAKTRGTIILASEHVGCDITEDMLYSCNLDTAMDLEKRKMKIAEYKVKETTWGIPDKTTSIKEEVDNANERRITVETEVQKALKKASKRRYGDRWPEEEDGRDYDFGETKTKTTRYNEDGIEEPYEDNAPIGEIIKDGILNKISKIEESHVQSIMDTIDQAVYEIDTGMNEDTDIQAYAKTIYDELREMNNKIKKIRDEEWADTVEKDVENDRKFIKERMSEVGKGKGVITV